MVELHEHQHVWFSGDLGNFGSNCMYMHGSMKLARIDMKTIERTVIKNFVEML
jgi:hypothetical protein